MRIRLAVVFVASLGLSAVFGQDAPKIKKVPVSSTNPGDGKEMFTTYCAVCHGADATGHGPAAAALKKEPADLTQLTIKNNGRFPEQRISLVLNSGPAEILSHGSKDMPVWGQLFKSLGSNGDGVARLRITNLTEYIKSIQRK